MQSPVSRLVNIGEPLTINVTIQLATMFSISLDMKRRLDTGLSFFKGFLSGLGFLRRRVTCGFEAVWETLFFEQVIYNIRN